MEMAPQEEGVGMTNEMMMILTGIGALAWTANATMAESRAGRLACLTLGLISLIAFFQHAVKVFA
jgi:hypothetical protein